MDFMEFWQETKKESLAQPLNVKFEDYSFDLDNIEVKRVYFDGYRCGKVDGLYIRSKGVDKKRPIMLFSHGYSTRIFTVSRYIQWLAAGYNVLAVNVRGQGEPINDDVPNNRVVSGIMTKGILNKEKYIYRYIYADFLRAVELAATLPESDGTVGVFGASQGGGIALMLSALDKRVKFVAALYPFMSCIDYGVEHCSGGPYEEIWRYFKLFDAEMQTKEQVFNTLSYFDNINFAPYIKCPVLMGIGLKDKACPPEASIKVFDTLDTENKYLHKYPAHGHEDIWDFEDLALQFAYRERIR